MGSARFNKKYHCDKHAGAVVLHENCDLVCPVCLEIADLKEEKEAGDHLLEVANGDWEDVLNELKNANQLLAKVEAERDQLKNKALVLSGLA
jgi:hypothetical protein